MEVGIKFSVPNFGLSSKHDYVTFYKRIAIASWLAITSMKTKFGEENYCFKE